MIPIVTPEEMAAIDAAAPEPVEVLIERAGVGRRPDGPPDARRHVRAHGQRDRRQGQQRRRRPGRGRSLAERGVQVRMFDAADCPPRLPDADLVIDAAYGTGFHGEWRAPRVGAAPVLAVDIPSGVDGLTGEAGRGVLPADRTVTFAALKPGLLFGAGRVPRRRRRGRRHRPRHQRAPAPTSSSPTTSRGWWRPRPPTAHKWSRAVRVVAGSPGMTGAAHLAAGAAQRAGSGMVSLSSPGVEPIGAAGGRPPPAPGVRLVGGRARRPRTASTPSSSAPASAARSTPSRRSGRPSPAPRCRSSSTATACSPWPGTPTAPAPLLRRRDGADRAHPARRRVRPARRAPSGRRPLRAPRAGWPPTPAPSCCSRVRRPSSPSPAATSASSRRATPGWRRPAPATCWPASSARCWPPGMDRVRRGAAAGAWIHAEAARCGPPSGSSPATSSTRCPACSERLGVTVGAGGPLGVGRDRPRRRRPQRRRAPRPPPRRRRCGPSSRPTATATAPSPSPGGARRPGATGLCVALTAEGVALREAGHRRPDPRAQRAARRARRDDRRPR